ncbi:MAG: hypothetical protein K1X51_17305 [Rhodospirillaceae bacterium]|nr:hypothetical protein [Rhodospirillaceae bacterium]
MAQWSKWRPFPDPRAGGILVAPFGPGCYQLRNRKTGLLLFGFGGHVAKRMTSLLPAPLGAGTRNNEGKRTSALEDIENLEYCTIACLSTEEAKAEERKLKANQASYRYPS